MDIKEQASPNILIGTFWLILGDFFVKELARPGSLGWPSSGWKGKRAHASWNRSEFIMSLSSGYLQKSILLLVTCAENLPGQKASRVLLTFQKRTSDHFLKCHFSEVSEVSERHCRCPAHSWAGPGARRASQQHWHTMSAVTYHATGWLFQIHQRQSPSD